MAELSASKKIRHLRKTELFSSCNEAELLTLAENSSFRRVKKGDSVFRIGEESICLYIVESGEIVISKPDNENRMIDIARFLPGDCFGELDMFTETGRNALALADTDARLLMFPGKGMKFTDMLKKHPEVSARILHKFLVQISGRIRKANSLVKENSPLIQELSRQVYRDKLTGLYNKTFFEEKLKGVMAAVTDKKNNLALIMLKPDNFKAINDAYGHEAGDQALRIMAKQLGTFIPETALLSRYMGNELAVLLPGADRREAFIMAEKIMDFMHEIDLREATGGESFLLSVSFGISLYPDHACMSDELILKAHELPLIGRGRGGNVILFPEEKQVKI